MLRLATAFAVFMVANAAHAIPFSLFYTLSDIGGGQFQYDFELVLDNNDGSHTAGDGYNWFSIGSGFTPGSANTDSPFSEGRSFFTSLPTDWSATAAFGGYDGPTLYHGGRISTASYTPSVGASIFFQGVSSTEVADGDLYFNYLVGSNTDTRQSFVAERVDATVPLPAGLPLILTGGLLLGLLRRKT